MRRVDFLVESVISVELKAVSKLEDVHFAQAINYLEAYNLEIGLLINFGETSLNFRRLNNKKYKPQTNVWTVIFVMGMVRLIISYRIQKEKVFQYAEHLLFYMVS